MHLYTECKTMVDEAIRECGPDQDSCLEYLRESCDGHEVSIYYGKAIEFCSLQDTSSGEQWLEDLGGIVQGGYTFGVIACRIAFATLLCECEKILFETLEDMEST